MDMIPLKAAARDPKAKSNQLRLRGIVPGIVYGSEVTGLSIECNEKELHKTFQKAGESTLVELDVDGKKIPVLFKHLQYDAISDREIHADFYAVNMKEEIETTVAIHFEGESPAVKDQAAVFVITHENLTVRCLPKDLPHHLIADISSMKEFHDVLTVKDIKLPAGVKIMDDETTVIATVQEPRAEEVITPVAAVPAEGEAVAGATAEGATPAEGAAPGAAAPEAAAKPEGKAEKKK